MTRTYHIIFKDNFTYTANDDVDLSSLEVSWFSLSAKQDFEDREGSCELEDTAILDLPLAATWFVGLPLLPLQGFM